MAPDRACQSCGHDVSADLRRCSGCRKVWYCSEECQKADWVAHKFLCNVGAPITTADHLALAVHRNLMPVDKQTKIDYGFSRADSSENKKQLLGLYIGLIMRMKVSPKKVHRWRINRTLVQEIKKAFSKLPEGSRGDYYPWFLQNLWVLDGSDENNDAETADWVAHKSRYNTVDLITTADHLALAVHRNVMPEDKQTEIDYGFSRADSSENRKQLLGLYTGLIERLNVSTTKLHQWRINGTLVQEIKKAFSKLPEGSRGDSYPWFLQNLWVLDGSDDSNNAETADWVPRKSRIKAEQPMTTADHLAVAVHKNLIPEDEQTNIDYGFNKAYSAENRRRLLGLYIGLIERLDVSPQQLHQWRINGTLVQEIKNAFSQLPEGSRGGYYPWFLQNLWVLDGSDDNDNRGLKPAEKRLSAARPLIP